MSAEQQYFPFNRAIDSIIFGSIFEIDAEWGIQQFNAYIAQVELLSGSTDSSGIFQMIREQKEKDAALRLIMTAEQQQEAECNLLDMQSAKIDLTSNKIPKGTILKMNLAGVMRSEDSMSSYGIKHKADQLYQAYANNKIAGIIIDSNSGGGESTAGQILYSAINDKNKPVVFLSSFTGSAAYKASLPADRHILNGKMASAGSIGSMYSISKKYLDWYKDNVIDIYSKTSPKKNHAFRELLKGNSEPLFEKATESANAFQAAVKAHRGAELSAEVLEGDMYYAEDAIKHGMADEIGTLNTAIDAVRTLSKSKRPSKGSNYSTTSKNLEMKGIVSQLNRIFGWSLGEDSSQSDVENKLSEQGTLQASVDAAVATGLKNVNEQIENLQTSLDEANAQIESNKTEADKKSSSDLKTIQEEMKAMKTQLDQSNAALAKLSGSAGDAGDSADEDAGKGAGGSDVNRQMDQDSEALFASTLEAHEIEGEAKYE